MTAGPLTLEDLERLEERAAEDVARWDAYRAQVKADPRSTTQEEAAMEACAASAARAQVPLLAALRSVMAERDALNGHLNAALRGLRDEQLARAVLKARVLDLRSMFVNLRWDGPAWVKTEEKLAMDLATELAGGKPLDS